MRYWYVVSGFLFNAIDNSIEYFESTLNFGDLAAELASAWSRIGLRDVRIDSVIKP